MTESKESNPSAGGDKPGKTRTLTVFWSKPADSRRFRCWLHLTPSYCVAAVLVVEIALWMSERLGWPEWPKGYAVLTWLSSLALVLVLLGLWFTVSLICGMRFQFGIRSLLLLTITVALGCGWLVTQLREAKRHDEAVQAITKLGGSVLFDFQLDASNNVVSGARPPGTAWLRSCMGDGFFIRAGNVNIDGPFTDADLKQFEVLTELRSLWLDSTDITDEGLAHLKGSVRLQTLGLLGQQRASKISGEGLDHLKDLPHLQELWLCNCAFTDEGLTQLGDLTQLKVLHLSNRLVSDQPPPPVTDTGLRHLRKLTKLESLDITGTYKNGTLMTDASLEHVKELKALRSLGLVWTDVTHAGLRHLTGLTELRELALCGNHVMGPGLKYLKELKHLSTLTLAEDSAAKDDKELVHLAGLTQLESLHLTGSPVTDAVMEHVASMPKLQYLNLNDAQSVTDAGLEKLKKSQ